MFVGGLPRQFGVSRVTMVMSDGSEHKLDLRAFGECSGALLMNQVGR